MQIQQHISFKLLGDYLTSLLRIVMGVFITKVGYDLASGNQYFGFYKDEGFLTGIFIFTIGCYFIFNSLFKQFLEK